MVLVDGSAELYAQGEIGQNSAEVFAKLAIRHLTSSGLRLSLYVSPRYLTAAEMLIGGRDRRMSIK